jgi:hypothetical protein
LGYVLKAAPPIPSGNPKFLSLRSLAYRFLPEEESFWEKKIRLVRKRKFGADGSEEYFEQVLQYASDAAIVSGVDCCRLAIDEFGLIFFSPLESKLGDFVCQSTGSEILMIAREIRRSNLGCQLVGSGVNLFETLRFREGESDCSCSKEPDYSFDTVRFSISISTL